MSEGRRVPVPAGCAPPGGLVITTLREAVGRAVGSPGTEMPLLHRLSPAERP